MTFPQYPQQQFGAPMPQPFPPQQYAPAPQYPVQQQYAPPPVEPAPAGTLDGFYSQPSSGGGPSLKFNGKQVGTSYSFIIARKLTNADVRAQTDNAGRPVTFRDGRAKYVLVVPVLIQHPEYPEGRATWWLKGQGRDELARAMAETGCPDDVVKAGPEAGAAVRVTLTGQRQVPNMNPQLLYGVEYHRPQNAGAMVSTPQPAPQTEQVAQPPVAQPLPVGQPQQVWQPQQVAQPPVAQAPVVQPPAAPQPPSDLSPEQQQLLAQLTGGQG